MKRCFVATVPDDASRQTLAAEYRAADPDRQCEIAKRMARLEAVADGRTGRDPDPNQAAKRVVDRATDNPDAH